MDFQVSVTDGNDAIVVHLAGELDMGTAAKTLAALEPVNLDGATTVVIDLAGLTFCDSSGLRLMLQLRRRVTTAGGEFSVTGAHGIVARTIEITGLTELLGSSSDA